MQKFLPTLLLVFCLYSNHNPNALGKGTLPKPEHAAPVVAAVSPPVKDSLATLPTLAAHVNVETFAPHTTVTPAPGALTTRQLLQCIAALESMDDDWKAANGTLYIGRYQVGREVLLHAGYSKKQVRHIFRRFRKDPSLFPAVEQERVIALWMSAVEQEMAPEISRFAGEDVNGVHVTKAGILASSHRVGTVGVKYWLRHGRCRHAGRVTATMKRYARTRMRGSFTS